MSNNKKGKGISKRNQHAAYKAEDRFNKNRMSSLLKHFFINPMDKVAEVAINRGTIPFRKHKSGTVGNKTKPKKFKINYAGYGWLPTNIADQLSR